MAAAGSHSKVAAGDNHEFGSTRRLKSPSDYAAILRAPPEQSIRAVRRLLCVNGAWCAVGVQAGNAATVRFGVTVGKRNARRSVDRVLIKRIVREACRQQASAFECCAEAAGVRIDVALRLKSLLVNAQGKPLVMAQWRRQIRLEADALLQHVLTELPDRLRPGRTAIEPRNS